MKTFRLTAVALLSSLSLFAASAHADPLFDLQDDAQQMQSHAGNLFHEIRLRYVAAPNYAQLVSQASQLYRHAAQLRVFSRSPATQAQLAETLQCMDGLYDGLNSGITVAARHSGHGHHHHHHGSVDTRPARELLGCIDGLIHEMEGHMAEMQVAPVYRPAPSYGVGYRGTGVTVGGPRFNVSFGR